MLKRVIKISCLGAFFLLFVFGFNYFQVKAADSVFPWDSWTKNAENPVLKDADSQCFFPEVILSDVNDPLRQPLLIAHPTKGSNYYWLYYETCWRGGGRLAYSSDLIHWTPYEGNPVITVVPGEVSLFIGNMFKDGNKYYLFYDIVAGCPNGTCIAIKYSSADSPFGPWERGSIVLSYGGPGEWDEGRVTETFIQKYAGTYYMYYMGDLPQPFGRQEQVGIATTPASNFPAGPWVKQGLKLPVNPDLTAWDRGLVADPSAIQVGDKFYLLYTGSWINAKWMLGVAWANHPLGPWNRPSAPILSPGPVGSWENSSILRGAIHYSNGRFYLPYAGSDGQNWQGGLATAKAITLIPGSIETPTLTPMPTKHPCPNYSLNCVRQDLPCPVGTVNDPYGSCGDNFRCCNPDLIAPTSTPTALPTPTPTPAGPTPTPTPTLGLSSLLPSPLGFYFKYDKNPVIDDTSVNGSLAENLLTDLADPLRQPLVYPHPTLGSKYWLVYANYGSGAKIRLAYSADLFNWKLYEGNPILAAGTGEYYLSSPNIFKYNDEYLLLYDVEMASSHGGAQRIAYATASSIFGPWTKKGVILDIGNAGEWDGGRVTEATWFIENDTAYLYYMGDALPPYGRAEQVGLAVTSLVNFPSGPWIKKGVVLPLNQSLTAWDRGLTADPALIKVNNTYYMLYTGSHTDAEWKIGIAWASHPLGPWSRPSEPTLNLGPKGWDLAKLVRGSIHYKDGRYYVPYSGYGEGRFRIGMAVRDPAVTPTPTPHSCPNYWTNCVRQDLPCPAGTVNDPYGSCGDNFRCCNPDLIAPTSTPPAGGPLMLTPTPTPIPTAGEPKTEEFWVANGAGDAYQQGGTMFVSGSQIKIGWYDNGVGFKMAGSDLAALKGKTIISAFLNVTSAANVLGNIVQKIYLQASDSCRDFTAGVSDITLRPTTISGVWWNVGTNVWLVRGRYASPDMAAVVSEVVQRPSWDGVCLCVILKEAGSANYMERYVYAKESGLLPASLRITYR